jgi:hypothetical protein
LFAFQASCRFLVLLLLKKDIVFLRVLTVEWFLGGRRQWPPLTLLDESIITFAVATRQDG